MPSQSQIRRALAGAFTLARFDRKGLEYLDFSYDGFWRSFIAVLLTLPAAITIALLWPGVVERFAELNMKETVASESASLNMPLFVVSNVMSFVAGWVFFPVAMIWISRMLDLGDRYVPLVVAFNWSRIVTGYAVMMPIVLFSTGAVSAEFMALIQFAVYGYVIAYRLFVIRTVTGVSGPTAFGLMLFSFLGTLLVEALVSQVYGLFESSPMPVPEPGNT